MSQRRCDTGYQPNNDATGSSGRAGCPGPNHNALAQHCGIAIKTFQLFRVTRSNDADLGGREAAPGHPRNLRASKFTCCAIAPSSAPARCCTCSLGLIVKSPTRMCRERHPFLVSIIIENNYSMRAGQGDNYVKFKITLESTRPSRRLRGDSRLRAEEAGRAAARRWHPRGEKSTRVIYLPLRNN